MDLAVPVVVAAAVTCLVVFWTPAGNGDWSPSRVPADRPAEQAKPAGPGPTEAPSVVLIGAKASFGVGMSVG